MAWALFNGEKKVSKSHDNKEVVYTEAIEKGFVLFSKGQRWLQEGVSIRETDSDVEPREPKIGDRTKSQNGDFGVIKALDHLGYCEIKITHNVNKRDLIWDESIKSWRYHKG